MKGRWRNGTGKKTSSDMLDLCCVHGSCSGRGLLLFSDRTYGGYYERDIRAGDGKDECLMAAKETVYLKAEQSIELTKPDVTVGDVMAVECVNPAMIARIKTMRILKLPESGMRRCVISVMRIVELIHREYPEAEIQNLGAPDFIVTYEDQRTPNKFLHWMKTLFIVLITFIGAAFSIMAFNNDVSTTKLFGQVYELLTGKTSDGFTVLELTYSIGLTVGILVFFNHFGGRKFSSDPTPMEVEMRLYENDIQTSLIQNYSREKMEIDIGEPRPKGRGGKPKMGAGKFEDGK